MKRWVCPTCRWRCGLKANFCPRCGHKRGEPFDMLRAQQMVNAAMNSALDAKAREMRPGAVISFDRYRHLMEPQVRLGLPMIKHLRHVDEPYKVGREDFNILIDAVNQLIARENERGGR